MTTPIDFRYALLKDVLPGYISVANHLAPSKATAAAGIRRGDLENSTYCANLHYELLRLQSLLPNFIGSQPQLRALGNVLGVFEKRLNRGTLRLPIRVSLAGGPEYEALGALQKILNNRKGLPCSGKQFEPMLGLHSREPKNRLRILNRIQDCSSSLETTEKPTTLVFPITNPKGSRLSSTSNKSPFAKIPEFANLVHQLLCHHYLSCGCPNSESHRAAKLRLRMPQNPPSIPAEDVQFELAFATSDHSRPWQEGEIQVSAAKETAKHKSTIATPTRQHRRLRFAEGTKPAHSPTPSRSEDQQKVQSICREIRNVVEARVRFLVYSNELWVLRPSRLQVQELKHGTFVTLHDLINSNIFKTLRQKDKYTLAYLIADSILHLYSGRWLENVWNKQQICFLANPGSQLPIDVKAPYLSAQCVDRATSKQDFYLIHPDQSILSLGIVLLEIATGIPIESRREGEQHPNIDLAIAEEMFKEFNATTSSYIPDHIIAIETCLRPEQIFQRYRSVEDIRWCLYENIVQPLRRIIEGSEIPVDKEEPPPKAEHHTLARVITVSKQPGESTIELTTASPKTSVVPIKEDNILVNATLALPKEPSSQPSEVLRPAFGFHLFHARADSDTSKGSNAWLETMKKDMHPRLSRDGQVQIRARDRGAGERIRIAILDTGYDPTAFFFHPRACRDRIKEYESWVDDEEDSVVRQDINGHGTHATALLLSISDRADIYVARIAKSSEELSSAILNVAQAIERAVQKWDVDIISMSFGFSHDVPKISQALTDAVHYKKGHLLLFAAASNSGGNSRLSFPASHPLVTSIRATTYDGGFPSYNPPPEDDEGICFGTLGENVLSAWPPKLDEEEETYQTGTSVATPIAAGVAAFILEYIRCEHGKDLLGQGLPGFDMIWDKLRRKKGMEILFKHISSSRDNKHFYVAPWRLFPAVEDPLRVWYLIKDKLEGVAC